MNNRLISVTQAWAAILALILASWLSCSLLFFRIIHFGELTYGFFVWNLFLAWIPAIASLILYSMVHARSERDFVMALIAILWFLFFPNAAYIVTDIVHLQARPPVPYWFDMITMMAFAQTGLFLGYLSLYLVQEVVRARFGRWYGWAFALTMLALSSFGIYLGRFLRWNSWDVLRSPLSTLRGVALVANPWIDIRPLQFSVMFCAFSLVCYLIVYSFTHLHGWTDRAPRTP